MHFGCVALQDVAKLLVLFGLGKREALLSGLYCCLAAFTALSLRPFDVFLAIPNFLVVLKRNNRYGDVPTWAEGGRFLTRIVEAKNGGDVWLVEPKLPSAKYPSVSAVDR